MSCYFVGHWAHFWAICQSTLCLNTFPGKGLTCGCRLEAEELPCPAGCQGFGGRGWRSRHCAQTNASLHTGCDTAQPQPLGACEQPLHGGCCWELLRAHCPGVLSMVLMCVPCSPNFILGVLFWWLRRVWAVVSLSQLWDFAVHMGSVQCRVTPSKGREPATIPAQSTDGYH